MPRIGNVEVSDDVVASLGRPVTPSRDSLGAIFAAGARGAYGALTNGLPYAAQQVAGNLTAEQEQSYLKGLRESAVAASAAAPASVDELTSGNVGFGRFVAENFAASLPYMAGTVVGGVGGFAAGGPAGALAGAVAGGAPQFGGTNAARAVEENGVLDDASATRSLAIAPLQSGADAAIGMFLPGVGKVAGGIAAQQSKGFVRRTAESIAKAAGTEAVTEAAQQLGERAAAGLPTTDADAAAEYINAAVVGASLGGVLGAGGGFRRGPSRTKPASQVTDEDMLSDIDLALAGPEAQLALPPPQLRLADQRPVEPGFDLEGGSAVGEQPNLLAQEVEESELLPSSLPQLALDPALSSLPPDTQLGFGQRFRDNLTPVDLPGVGGSVVTPELEAALAQAGNTGPNPLSAGTAQGAFVEPQGLDFVPPGAASAIMEAAASRRPSAQAALSSGTALASGADLGGYAPAVPVEARRALQSVAQGPSDTLSTGTSLGSQSRVELPTDFVAASDRPFASEPAAELSEALSAKAPAELRAAAQAEITQRQREATGQAELTTENFQTRVDDMKVGLRGQWVAKLEAKTPQELAEKTYVEAFENANTTVGVQKMAQRLGLLDQDLQPTQAALDIEASRAVGVEAATTTGNTAVAAPSPVTQDNAGAGTSETVSAAPSSRIEPNFIPQDSTFEQEWKGIAKRAGVTRFRSATELSAPPTRQAAEARVMEALSTDAVTRGGEASQVERLGQELGLLTNDGGLDITAKGREAFLRAPGGANVITAAAKEQGYTDAQVATFDRGVRAQINGATDADSFGEFADLEAYETGKAWAKSFVQQAQAATASTTDRVLARDAAAAAAAAKRAADGTAVARKISATLKLTPEQAQRQAQNRILDAANMRTVNDANQAELRRMVRDGATTAELEAALKEAQGGKVLFKQPPRGEIPTLTTPDVRRRMPTFEEMNTVDETPSKREQRVESEAAVRTYELRAILSAAAKEGRLPKAREARFQKMLDEGKVDQVDKLVTGLKPRATPASEQLYDREALLGGTDEQFEQAVDGKSFSELLKHMVDSAPSGYHRELMMRIRTLSQMLEKQGMSFEFRVVKPGDVVPREMEASGVKAITYTTFSPQHKATIYVGGSQMGPEGALNYQVVAHELLHSVTSALVVHGRQDGQRGTKLGKAVAALDELFAAVKDNFERKLNRGIKLNDFEERFYLRENNAIADPDELLAWGLTNPEMQQYLNSIQFDKKQSIFSRLVQLVRDVLGLTPKQDSVLAELLRVSEQLFTLSRRDLAPILARNNPDSDIMVPRSVAAQEGGAAAASRTAQGADDLMQQAMAQVSAATENLNVSGLKRGLRRFGLSMISQTHMDRLYADKLAGMNELSLVKRTMSAMRAGWAQLGMDAYQQFELLQKNAADKATLVEKLMAMATEFQLDPDKAWADHTHLKDEPNVKRLEEMHEETQKARRKLKSGDGLGWAVFQRFRKLNEAQNYARMAVSLHEKVALDPELKNGVLGSEINPAEQFSKIDGLTDPAEILNFWKNALGEQLQAVENFTTQKKGEAARGTSKDINAVAQHLSPIESQVRMIREAIAGMNRAPYFHLGRNGDYFGSAVLRKTEAGVVDPKAVEHIAKVLEQEGFTDAQISADTKSARIALRFQKQVEADKFRTLMEKLKKQGWLDQDENIKAGPRAENTDTGVAGELPEYVRTLLENIETDPRFTPDESMTTSERASLDTAKKQAKQITIDTWIEMQPDSSIAKVLTKRYGRPGYSKNMANSWATRFDVGARNISGVAAGPALHDAYVKMQDQLNKAIEGESNPYIAHDIIRELKLRDASNPVNEVADAFDKLRAAGHAYFLGMSPAYALINLTQLGVVALPELAKVHGYTKSFGAMRRGSNKAFAVLKAANAVALKLDKKHWADITLTNQVLVDAGLNAKERAYVNRMIALSSIDIGSAARAFGQITTIDQNSKFDRNLDTSLKYASAFGLYTETFSRLTVAMAALEMHKGDMDSAVAYGRESVTNAMFEYQNWNTGRQLGKKGFLGPATPLLTQFLSYSIQITEKLYSEALDAVGSQRPGESAENAALRKKGARRFLLGHTAAVGALAGSLGLPFATTFIAVLEKLVGDEDEPFDASAAYRGYLSDMFGPGMAEVLARGVPRALGFDISQRAGEADLMPFSDLISDKRSWQESVQAYMGRNIGASPSMLLNIAEGGSEFAKGNFLGGAKTFLPVAFKGPIETYRMTQEGYVDSRGTALPLTPTGSAFMWQLLGFAPSEKSEYSEARRDQQTRRGELTRRAGRLRSEIIKAIEQGDSEAFNEKAREAVAFDRLNPAYSVLDSVESSMKRRQEIRQRSVATGSPMGVALEDIAGQQLTDYANVEYTP